MRELLAIEGKPVIGVVHLPPLPGSPRFSGNLEDVIERAVSDAKALEEGGVDAVIVENYGDAPFAVRVREPETIAAMTVVVREVVRSVSIPVGVSLLRNSGPEAVAVAYASGAAFIRVNALCEARVAPEGILEPVAREVELKRRLLGWKGLVLADIDVKHSLPLGEGYNPRLAAREVLHRCKPDALVVTGARTGEAPEPGYVAVIREAVPHAKLLLGSGVTPDNIRLYWRLVDGFIVGSYFKKDGVTTNPVDPQRVERLMRIVERLRQG
ncbi:photosystem I assembly BtpA [Pyrolobus fumarii 1A]|uniref:Photosystem I assembly BtpA n=1 Tax=Pyrolobus fumarii (strain DSM 11204 / 1A) TaxID=694429 RepID=G0EGQ2_PYRF1|nr:BtpA/SgcQ family protein [Pyrolobus fumarii]AEM39200.1 photosystem I assembly BtpA [Pyrolobus fumarii 1A]